eukprot:4524410-Pyramimonas_sp.AAC.1
MARTLCMVRTIRLVVTLPSNSRAPPCSRCSCARLLCPMDCARARLSLPCSCARGSPFQHWGGGCARS